VPGDRSASIRCCLAQPRSVSGTTPTRGPIRETARSGTGEAPRSSPRPPGERPCPAAHSDTSSVLVRHHSPVASDQSPDGGRFKKPLARPPRRSEAACTRHQASVGQPSRRSWSGEAARAGAQVLAALPCAAFTGTCLFRRRSQRAVRPLFVARDRG
jgi:hypothetical protein